MGSESPASVAFAVYLIDVASGKMLWTGKFAETQRTLSDNVLDTWAFVKKGQSGFLPTSWRAMG